MARVARGFIINRVDQTQEALLFYVIDTGFAIGRKQDLCFILPVTSVTGLRLLIHDCPNLGTIGRDRDLSLFIENSHLDNPLSLGDVIDDPLVFVSSIFDHGISNAQTDGLAEVEGFLFSFIEDLPGERTNVEVEEDPFNHHDDNDDTEKNLSL
jgi:hypothetical protein